MVDKSQLQQVGRLALRVEGAYWNAYYAKPDTMDGAILLGSIQFSIIAQNETHKQAFMNMMRAVVGDLLSGIAKAPVTWLDPVKAPEHERTKE